MHFERIPTTIDEQIALLRSRGRTIASEDVARRSLETVGCDRLIAGRSPFKATPDRGQTRSETVRGGATFAPIVDLRVVDRKLRLLITEARGQIGIAVQAWWTNRMILAHGPQAHLRLAC